MQRHIKATGNVISTSFKAGRWLVPDSNSKWFSWRHCSVVVSSPHHLELEAINGWSTWAKTLKKSEAISAGKCTSSLLIAVSKPWHSKMVRSRHLQHNFPSVMSWPSQHCFNFFWLNPNTTDLHLASKMFKHLSQSVLLSKNHWQSLAIGPS